MTIAQKNKETRVGIKDGNRINLCSVYPANNPYIYALLSEATQRICWDCWLDIQNKDSILHPYPCFEPTFLSNGHPYIFLFHGNVLVPGLFFLSFMVLCIEFILLCVCRDR